MNEPTDFQLAFLRKRDEVESVFESAYPDMHDRDEKLHITNALGIMENPDFVSKLDPDILPYIPSQDESLDVLAAGYNNGFPFKVKKAQLEGIKAQFEAGILTEEQALQSLDLIASS